MYSAIAADGSASPGTGRPSIRASQAERAGGRCYARLLIGQAEAGVAHRLALMVKEGQQAVEFAGDRPGVHRHRTIMASGTDIACWPDACCGLAGCLLAGWPAQRYWASSARVRT